MRDWLAHRADATPEAPALCDGDGTVTTYATLDADVEELAGRLSTHGVGVDDHLGVVMETRPAFVEVVHAAMRVGATLVPLNARLTEVELAERLDVADVDCLLCGAETAERAVAATAALGRDLPVAGLDGGTGGAADLLGADPEAFEVPALTLDGIEVMLFTSGTTGRPKAVCLTAANLAASAAPPRSGSASTRTTAGTSPSRCTIWAGSPRSTGRCSMERRSSSRTPATGSTPSGPSRRWRDTTRPVPRWSRRCSGGCSTPVETGTPSPSRCGSSCSGVLPPRSRSTPSVRNAASRPVRPTG